MSQYDVQYDALLKDILENGYSNEGEYTDAKWKDGTPAYTKSLIGRQFRFDNSEIPILTTKRVAWKTAIAEMLWIWNMRSNVVQDLRNLNMTFNGGKNKSVWDEWENKQGTIGLAYGHQLGEIHSTIPVETKLGVFNMGADQVDQLIWGLKNKPHSRRHVTEIWNVRDLDRMMLPPCVHLTQWHVKGGKLHLEVRARSSDVILGNPFNVTQYSVLHRMIAQVTGYELGEFIFYMGDVHIYDRHIDLAKEQMEREQHPAPKLWINPEVKNFEDFRIEDFDLIDYKHSGDLKAEIAIS
jgi:thymidylate synthase